MKINKRIRFNKKGFTLVELLVVVAIIAILSVIGLTVFSGVQANARDTRRKADIDAIAKALETNKAVGVKYSKLTAAQFSSVSIPQDNGGSSSKPNYCVRFSAPTGGTATAILSTSPVITNWAITAQCPTGGGDNADPTYTVWSVISDTSAFDTTGYLYWKICTRLENNTTYCRGNSQ